MAKTPLPEAQRHGAPLSYLSILGILIKQARALGYTLAVHGSMARDLDLIAVPWSHDCVADPDQLIAALCEVCSGFVDRVNDFPAMKPHGRWAYIIHLGAGYCLDVSVMPRTVSGFSETLAPFEPAAYGE